MPCVILLLETQHSRLFETAQNLARTAGGGEETWPGDLYAFRQLLSHHDRMEREVLDRLGAPPTAEGLIVTFDRVLASQPGLDRQAVASAARQMTRAIEDHAQVQEVDLFPALVDRHPLSLRRQLGYRYIRPPADTWSLDPSEKAIA